MSWTPEFIHPQLKTSAFNYYRNAFPNAYTNEKVFVARAGPEFGEHKEKCIIIRKALYGLCSSSERWRSHQADTF
eukprot:2063331-Ditylum_brightwellii.AAC.1